MALQCLDGNSRVALILLRFNVAVWRRTNHAMRHLCQMMALATNGIEIVRA